MGLVMEMDVGELESGLQAAKKDTNKRGRKAVRDMTIS
jgi:hypothetical protein